MTEPTLKIRWKAKSANSIEFGNLLKEEAERMEGVLHGTAWMTVGSDGRAVFVPATNPLPAPTDDPMLPWWRPIEPERAVSIQTTLFADDYKHVSPSFIIQHLCGYNYTPEFYRTIAARLESYGFECLRSRRAPDGQYWELWLLSGLWQSRGALAEVVGEADRFTNSKKLVDRIVGFLCSTVSFGTLDVVTQRAAMTVD